MQVLPKSRGGKIRLLILLGILVWVIIRVVALPCYWYLKYQPEAGDIVFQSLPRVELVKAIEGITESSYSHCGAVINRQGRWWVTEALGTVHDTPLFSWIMQGRGCRFAVYRLKPDLREYIPPFLEALKKQAGKPYDFRYDPDDSALYCSELVFKAFKQASGIELGHYVRLGDMNWRPYEKTIRELEGGPPPLDRLIISPKSLSQSQHLIKVFDNGLPE